MLFRVIATNGKVPENLGCYVESFIDKEEENCLYLDEHPDEKGIWFSEGFNHSSEKNPAYILNHPYMSRFVYTRDIEVKDKAIKLDSLDDLVSFVEKVGEVIIYIDSYDQQVIEIYNDYRE